MDTVSAWMVVRCLLAGIARAGACYNSCFAFAVITRYAIYLQKTPLPD
jgi:hypothetical protein